MSKQARIHKLGRLLQTMHRKMPVSKVAEQLNCSEKTVRRDVREMQGEYGAPWIIHNNYITWGTPKHQSVHLEGYWFTSEELLALLAFHHTITQLSHGLLSQELELFKQKILQLLGGQITEPLITQKIKLIEIAAREIDDHIFNALVQALQNQQQIQINFWNRATDQQTTRIISPQQLVRYRDRWLLDAWCHQKQAIRSFSLDGIKQVELLDEAAKQMSQQQIAEHFETSYGIFSGQADKSAKLVFSPYIARWIQYETWHTKQQTQWMDDGRYQMILPYKHDIELMQDILKYGAQVEVIEPQELRNKIKQELEKTLKQYARDKICP